MTASIVTAGPAEENGYQGKLLFSTSSKSQHCIGSFFKKYKSENNAELETSRGNNLSDLKKQAGHCLMIIAIGAIVLPCEWLFLYQLAEHGWK